MLSLRENRLVFDREIIYLYKDNRLKFLCEENLSLSFLNILLNRVSLTIVLEDTDKGDYHPLYNDVFLLTVIKFFLNEIQIEGVFFSELSRPMQRRIESYEFNCIFIDRNQNQEEVKSLISNLKAI